jgi:hypothetical protein
MNTEVTQTLGEGDKQDLARYEYRNHTNSRQGDKPNLARYEYRRHPNSRRGEQTGFS